MPKCKDCIHYEICLIRDELSDDESEVVSVLECEHFKDRSRFVELPCKVYTTFIGRVVEAKIYGYEASMKNSNCSWTIEPQHFGKYVFFTQEAAEQALKERENNAGRNDT